MSQNGIYMVSPLSEQVPNSLGLKGPSHGDFAVLGQICAKIIANVMRLKSLLVAFTHTQNAPVRGRYQMNLPGGVKHNILGVIIEDNSVKREQLAKIFQVSI